MTQLVWACIQLATLHHASADDARAVCGAILDESPDLDPALVAGIAWRESRFSPRAEGARGELGALQAQPRYLWPTVSVADKRAILLTPRGGVVGGLELMRVWAEAHPDRWEHCYASGNRCHAPRSVRVGRAWGSWLRVVATLREAHVLAWEG